MVWEMLYNPSYSLPTAEAEAAWFRAIGKAPAEDEEPDASELEGMSPEELAVLVSKRARVIAERAFWDSIVWRLRTGSQGGRLPSQVRAGAYGLGSVLMYSRSLASCRL
jgi:hypothetical protein